MKKLELHWQILIGMALGVLFALLMVQFDWGPKIVSDWIKPFGNIFINSLKLIAVPLILASLIKGVSDLKDISKLSKMGGRTIGIYIVTTIIAVTIGLLVVNVVKPGGSITEDTRNELVENYKGDADNIKTAADKQDRDEERQTPRQTFRARNPRVESDQGVTSTKNADFGKWSTCFC